MDFLIFYLFNLYHYTYYILSSLFRLANLVRVSRLDKILNLKVRRILKKLTIRYFLIFFERTILFAEMNLTFTGLMGECGAHSTEIAQGR